MALECPEDNTCWDTRDQYFLGEEILVAPVLKHIRSRQIYLPQGRWVDFWTGQVTTGPAWITYPVPKPVIPVFIKENSIIPVQLNHKNEMAGKISQDEKDSLKIGFLVFPQDDAFIERTWKIYDPRKTRDTSAAVSLTRQAGKTQILSLHPASAGVFIISPTGPNKGAARVLHPLPLKGE